jgi:hypothetical protein
MDVDLPAGGPFRGLTTIQDVATQPRVVSRWPRSQRTTDGPGKFPGRFHRNSGHQFALVSARCPS